MENTIQTVFFSTVSSGTGTGPRPGGWGLLYYCTKNINDPNSEHP